MPRAEIQYINGTFIDYKSNDIPFNFTPSAKHLYNRFSFNSDLTVSTLQEDKAKARGVITLLDAKGTIAFGRMLRYSYPDSSDSLILCEQKVKQVLGDVPQEIYIL